MGKCFEFGMNIHRCGYESYPAADLENNLRLCRQAGADIIRFNQTCSSKEGIDEVKRVSEICHLMGMKLMLVVDLNGYLKTESLSCIETDMEEHYRNLSSALRDCVDVYQVFNEIDVHCMGGDIANIFLTPADGKEKGEYDCVLWDRSKAAVRGALKGMKAGYPEGKTCINFAWWHTAFIYELYREGMSVDIIGLDWYSDCEEVSSIQLLMNDVSKNIPDAEFMICECNFWMNLHDRYTPEYKDRLKEAENRDKWQAEWVPEFIDKLVKIDNPRLKSVIFYELLDEPAYEQHIGKYTGESHFGFVGCERNGSNQKPKPAYFTLKEKIKEIKNF